MKKINLLTKNKIQIANNPFTDWIVILSVAGVLALALIGVGSSVYFSTESELSNHGTTFVPNNRGNFDVQKLNQVISIFDARASERVLLSKGYSGLSDPSLP